MLKMKHLHWFSNTVYQFIKGRLVPVIFNAFVEAIGKNQFRDFKEYWPKNNPKFYPLASSLLSFFYGEEKGTFRCQNAHLWKIAGSRPILKDVAYPQLLVFSLSWVILLRQSKHLSKNTASCSTSYSVAFPCQKDNNSKLFSLHRIHL